MPPNDSEFERLDRRGLEKLQLERLRRLLGAVLESNPFYRRKLRRAGIEAAAEIQGWDDYRRLPFTEKTELSVDQSDEPPFGTNLTFPIERYVRLHQTSGTKGEPLRWLDTAESWDWWGRCWEAVYRGAGVDGQDRIFFAFSFGPFIGFWSAHEGARRLGALCLSGGGMSSLERLRALLGWQASVLVSTPTYALHLAEVARREKVDLASSQVRVTIHAGEPGAGLPAVRQRIQALWGADCYDHAGATEVGAWSFECERRCGLHLNEAEFLFEVADPETGNPSREGELIVTSLGRTGMPVIRYRTGDRVRLGDAPCRCGRSFRQLEGGVIGRIDDAFLVRGVNVFPGAIENIVRRFPEIGEFAVEVTRRHQLDELELKIEIDPSADPDAVMSGLGREMRHALGLRIAVTSSPQGSLPRFELKSRRVRDLRNV